MISEREKLEYESLPEFVREPRVTPRDSYAAAKATAPQQATKTTSPYTAEFEKPLPKAAELEVLWPGVGADFIHSSRRGPSFYLMLGFMGGAVASLIAVFSFSVVTGMVAHSPADKGIVVAHGNTSSTSQMRSGFTTAGGTNNSPATTQPGVTTISGAADVVLPSVSTYEVKTGDTLAGIALQTYKRATPRLLDEICRANGMRNADVLSLGQKLVLPEYHPQQVANTGTIN